MTVEIAKELDKLLVKYQSKVQTKSENLQLFISETDLICLLIIIFSSDLLMFLISFSLLIANSAVMRRIHCNHLNAPLKRLRALIGFYESSSSRPPCRDGNAATVLHKGQWVPLPFDFISIGDTVYFDTELPAPCKLANSERIFYRSELLPPGKYRVLETFAVESVREFFSLHLKRPLDSKESPLLLRFNLWKKMQSKALLALVLLGMFMKVVLKSEVNLSKVLFVFYLSTFELLPRAVCLYANARIHALMAGLKDSQIPFDAENDEFDEDAPPPRKEIALTMRSVWSHLSCGSFLFDRIGHLGVLGYLDRLGVLTRTFPTVEQIVVLEEELEVFSVSLSLQKVGTLLLEDRDWANHRSTLMPIGLSTVLLTNCALEDRLSARRDFHLNDFMTISANPSLLACHCALGKAMGFGLPPPIRIEDGLQHRAFATRIIVDANNEKHHLGFGQLDSILSIAGYYWNGLHIVELDTSMKKLIAEYQRNSINNDLYIVGYFYAAVKEFDTMTRASPLNTASLDLEQPIVLTGLTACSLEPKPEVCEFITDLLSAGTRFVYFSPFREAATKAFGERLGLETDWNACIILGETGSMQYTATADIKANLPRGPNEIRKHLQAVDDIPLHVSFFAASHPKEIREMLDIYRKEAMPVGLIGLASVENLELFSHSDVAISVETGDLKASISSDLILNSDDSPYILTSIMRESRILCLNAYDTLVLFIGLMLTFSLSLLFAELERREVILVVLVSLVSSAIVFFADSYDEVLWLMMDQNDCVVQSDRAAILWVLRILPIFLVPVLLERKSLYLIYSLNILSSTLCWVNSLDPVWRIPPRNVKSISTVTGLIAVCLFFLKNLLLKSLFYILLVLTLNEIAKQFQRHVHQKTQKRRKLEFNTRLGMHSPV